MKFRSPTAPMAHQREYERRLLRRPSEPSDADVMALLCEMGTGKSKMLLDEWQRRCSADDLTDLLVVAPSGSYKNWFEDKSDLQPSELNAHVDPALLERAAILPWVTGGGAKMRDRLSRGLAHDGPRALFVNVEAISTVQAARDLIAEFLSRGRATWAIDESTAIKGESKRTKAIVKMASLAPARRIATGLVTPRSPMDLFRQFEFLDWRILGYRSLPGFRARYAITKQMEAGGRRFEVIVGFKNVDELTDLIAPYSFRVLKSECLDLEPKTYEFREVELTDEQRRVYREIREFATAEVGEGKYVTATSVITQMIRMHQVVCGHVMDEEKCIHDVKSRRADAVLDLLGEHGGKAVIWVTYRHELEKLSRRIREEFGENSVAEFHGGNKAQRSQDERRFLGDPECRFMLSTQAAGARGNTWNVADLVIYAANSHDLELRSQSEDRCHRKGQTRKVTYVDLICRGTVEERIVKSLRKKIDMATLISGENYREWLV